MDYPDVTAVVQVGMPSEKVAAHPPQVGTRELFP